MSIMTSSCYGLAVVDARSLLQSMAATGHTGSLEHENTLVTDNKLPYKEFVSMRHLAKAQ